MSMNKRTRYHVAQDMQTMCALLKIDPKSVLRRAGLPPDYFDHDDRGLLPHQIFALWDAAAEEYRRPDFPVFLGKSLAHGIFGSVVLAFTCSHTVQAGLNRIAIFKPLIGPIQLDIHTDETRLTLSITSTEPQLDLPAVLGAMDLVFFVELIRTTTAEHVVPLSASLPDLPPEAKDIEAHLGIRLTRGRTVSLTISRDDAERRLVTENPNLWAVFETDLKRKLEAQTGSTPTADRLRDALYEMLPSGQSSVEAACQKLHLSKRSLQRHLQREGSSFQKVLDATRSELSLHYLRMDNISIEEISYLLAFRDPNSFYRAFHNWTGMTPAQARSFAE
ncbi:MAG: AraC family transcriptional regulator [Rhodobacteraceae bacterium]|nr:AraC family transcriptional regulator [Paracoccaceae bacterium]